MIIVLLKHVLKNYYDLYKINVIYLRVHDFLVLLRQYRQQMSFFFLLCFKSITHQQSQIQGLAGLINQPKKIGKPVTAVESFLVESF